MLLIPRVLAFWRFEKCLDRGNSKMERERKREREINSDIYIDNEINIDNRLLR